jgi:hypothetical protein
LRRESFMNFDAILAELIELLQAAGVKVRREPLEDSRGGLCRLGAASVLFLDTHADPLQSATLCAQTLRRVVDVNTIYLRPNLREFIETAEHIDMQE